MRLEHHGGEGRAERTGKPLLPANDRLMSEMHAIEIADGEDAALEIGGNRLVTSQNLHMKSPAALCILGYAGRTGTIRTASPASTVLPLTEQSQAKMARRFSGINSVSVTLAMTSSPIRTGARKFSVCDT